MTSNILPVFLALAFVFEIVHAWEEHHFTYVSPHKGAGLTGINLGKKLPNRSKEESGLIVYKIMMVIMMLLLTLITAGGAFKFIALIILGLYFTFQLHHILDWAVLRKYNSGLVTSILWLPVVVMWWVNFRGLF